MKHWLILTLALAVFAAGVAVGRVGRAPNVARALPAPPSDSYGPVAKGAAGGALSWEQYGSLLTLTVTGPDTTYLGVAGLTDENALPELGSGAEDILFATGTFDLDLSAVEALTFYKLEPVAALADGVFIPCEELPAGCFPVRPDPPPPWTDLVFANQN